MTPPAKPTCRWFDDGTGWWETDCDDDHPQSIAVPTLCPWCALPVRATHHTTAPSAGRTDDDE